MHSSRLMEEAEADQYKTREMVWCHSGADILSTFASVVVGWSSSQGGMDGPYIGSSITTYESFGGYRYRYRYVGTMMIFQAGGE
jgi:hypothetical protein